MTRDAAHTSTRLDGDGAEVDLVVEATAMLPMTGPDVVYDALIAVRDGRIVWAGPRADAPHLRSGRRISVPDSVVMPGLVNAHTHVGSLFFGTLADEANLINSLYDLFFPMEVHFDAEMMHAAASVGFWDAVRSGVTCVCDHYHYPEATAQAATEIGVRGLIADKIIEFKLDAPPLYNRTSQTYSVEFDRKEAERRLAANVDFVERWRNHDLVTPVLGPHAPDTLSTEMLRTTARAAEELGGVKMLMHVAQSRAEVAQIRRLGYEGSIRYLEEIGFLSPLLQAAHMVYLSEEEIAIAGRSGMGMSYNPVVLLACHAFPQVDKLISSGIRMGMGTDCLSFDQLDQMRYAIYLANYLREDSGFQLSAFDLLRMATIGGAEALGLDREIGTIEVGKRADLVVISMRDGQLVTNTNYFESIAYYAKSRNVTHTIVNGRIVYADGQLQLAGQDAIFDNAERLARRWVGLNREFLDQRGIGTRIQPHFFDAPARPLLPGGRH